MVRERHPEIRGLMGGFGKSLENLVRAIRPYLKPSYRSAFASLKARGMSQRKPGEPLVCFDFSNQAIDAVGGRYYFSLVLDFIDAGYFPVFTARRGTVSTFGTSPIKSLLLPKRLGVVERLEEIDGPFVLVTDSEEVKAANAQVIRMDYTWRTPGAPGEVAFPVFVHPRIAVMDQIPMKEASGKPRQARIFFGGNTSPDKYDKNVIGELYGMLTRREMLAVARGTVGEEGTWLPKDADEWLGSDEPRTFVLCETQHCRIPRERWLDAMAKADFFLACPGVGMPLCHNLIEAMAAGAIPILQYTRYLDPPLRDGIECLAFHDAESLEALIERVVGMDPAEVERLREGVKTYFNEWQAPGMFARNLVTPPAERLLINSYRVPR